MTPCQTSDAGHAPASAPMQGIVGARLAQEELAAHGLMRVRASESRRALAPLRQGPFQPAAAG
jgi:hypothetical protein